MGRKVLISFLGTGPNDNKTKQRQERKYRPANYVFKDFNTDTISKEDAFKTSFVADALVKKYDIDSIILLGTVHSMWERVYEIFCANNNLPVDEEYYCNLADHCDNADHNSELSIPSPEKIEEVLGKSSHILLLKYGLNDAEIAYNTQVILGIEKLLQGGDELYLDITHSFRSLPIYLMNCLIFLKNVSKKQISINSISYGMLDVSTEYPTGKKNDKGEFCEFYTPVVDLKKLIEVQEWITGAYNFQEFGNTYKLATLLENSGKSYQRFVEPIRKFAEVKNLNYISDFKSQMQGLAELRKAESVPPIGQMVITPVINDFLKEFSTDIPYYTFQYRMAKWHHSHHNYGYALLLLIESCVSYCCDELKIDSEYSNRNLIQRALVFAKKDREDPNVKQMRDKLMNNFGKDLFSHILKGQNEKGKEIGFKVQNHNRNTIAHLNDNDKSYKEILSDLRDGILFFKTYLDTN